MPNEPSKQPPTSDSLPEALARHGIDLPDDQVEVLDGYCRKLWDFNTRLNLTRHTDYERFVKRDMVDALAIAAHLEHAERVLDVGTGGGVPGIVLAVTRPDLSVTLAESVGKKARVVQQIITELGLKTVVHHARAEVLLERETFDSLVVRAVAPLPKLLTWFQPHWGAFDRLLVVKGPAWIEERRESRARGLLADLQLRKIETWPLPDTDSESVLLEIRPRG